MCHTKDEVMMDNDEVKRMSSVSWIRRRMNPAARSKTRMLRMTTSLLRRTKIRAKDKDEDRPRQGQG